MGIFYSHNPRNDNGSFYLCRIAAFATKSQNGIGSRYAKMVRFLTGLCLSELSLLPSFFGRAFLQGLFNMKIILVILLMLAAFYIGAHNPHLLAKVPGLG